MFTRYILTITIFACFLSLGGCSSPSFKPPPNPTYVPSVQRMPTHETVQQRPETSLHEGSTGHGSVVSLQQAMQRKGYYWGSVDGVYGTETRTAVKRFQQDLGVPDTGVAGNKEWSALGLSSGSPPDKSNLEPAKPEPAKTKWRFETY